MSVRMLATLPDKVADDVRRLSERYKVSISEALRWLIIEGLRQTQGDTAAEATRYCDCDMSATCANAFGRDHTGHCRRL